MTAYWISLYEEITDDGKFAAYAALAGPALRKAGAVTVARGLPEQVYELGRETRTVIMVFPSVDAARKAHDSAEYQAALAALDGGARREIRIIPGVSD